MSVATPEYDAIIIGAGIMGCGIAYGLAKKGSRILVLDKNPAAGYGSTSNSAAVIRTFFSTEASCALAWEGLHYWRNWEAFLGVSDERGLIRFIQRGCVFLRNGEPDGMDVCCKHFDRLGIPWEAWDVHHLAQKLPFLDLRRFTPPRRHDDPSFGHPARGRVTGALYFPESGFVTDPQLATHNLQVAAAAKGVAFRFHARVSRIVAHNGRVAGVQLENGEAIAASVVVNAAGPYSNIINTMAGVERAMAVRTRALRQEICHVPAPSGADLNLIIADPDIASYLRPESGNSLLIGSTQPPCDPLEWVDDPDNFNRNPTEQWTTQVHRQALRIPSLPIPSRAAGVVDLYDVTDDWTPIYDCSDLPGFYMAVGTSGNQFKNGPVAGQLMARLIDYCESGNNHDEKPYRFPFAYTRGSVDVSAFSRRRSVDRKATEGVLG